MLTNLILALEISALGMGLVFFAIIMLWLMMWALTAIRFKAAGEVPTVEVDPANSDGETSRDLKAAAAAAAVAIALAEQSQSIARPMTPSPTALISAWQLGMRTRQMYEKGEKR
jgi:Na+-transporting methylmalonyl-CoA/oxaloacetate decarboxylase gamma subunit